MAKPCGAKGSGDRPTLRWRRDSVGPILTCIKAGGRAEASKSDHGKIDHLPVPGHGLRRANVVSAMTQRESAVRLISLAVHP
jgi:hypothetical protein